MPRETVIDDHRPIRRRNRTALKTFKEQIGSLGIGHIITRSLIRIGFDRRTVMFGDWLRPFGQPLGYLFITGDNAVGIMTGESGLLQWHETLGVNRLAVVF